MSPGLKCLARMSACGPARRLRSVAVVGPLVFLATRLVGCGHTSLSDSQYDQTCQQASDCIAVGTGDPCTSSCGEFPSTGAIAAKAQLSYEQDALTAQYGCARGCGEQKGCETNIEKKSSAYCAAGRCTVCDDPNPCTCAPASDPSCAAQGTPEGGTPTGDAGDASAGETGAGGDGAATEAGDAGSTGEASTGGEGGGSGEAGGDAPSEAAADVATDVVAE